MGAEDHLGLREQVVQCAFLRREQHQEEARPERQPGQPFTTVPQQGSAERQSRPIGVLDAEAVHLLARSGSPQRVKTDEINKADRHINEQ